MGKNKVQESLLLIVETSVDGHFSPSSAFFAREWRQSIGNIGENVE